MNKWSDAIKHWGQDAIDGNPIILDQAFRRWSLFEAVKESLLAKENPDKIVYLDHEEMRVPKLTLVPLSGGMDSLIVRERAVDAGEEVISYYVEMNTPYAQHEIDVLDNLEVDYVLVDDHSLWPLRWEPYKTKWKHILPLRNLLIISVIAELADDRPGNIALGATEGEIPDKGGDKSRRFFSDVDEILSCMPIKHQLAFPLEQETKTDIVAWWLAQGKDPNRLLATLTCQSPKTVKRKITACGECHACFNRWIALINNGLSEPMVKHPKNILDNADKIQQFRTAKSLNDYSVWSARRISQAISAWEK